MSETKKKKKKKKTTKKSGNKSKSLKNTNKKKSVKKTKKTQNNKPSSKPKQTQKKQETNIKKEKETKLPYLYIAFIIILACIFGYRYLQENHINNKNYIFQTNMDNTTVQISSSTKKLDILNENISDTTLSINPYYDQILITNDLINEILSNDEIFFDYYGEDSTIMTINSQYTIVYLFYNPIDDNKVTFVSDNDSVTISNNIITSIKDGETTIYACYGDKKIKLIDILSTSLIVERPKEFDETKPFLTCEQYSDEENAILDKILETKINDAGYQTRAGAVEALRFLTLDMPYRVNYFNENGRLPYVDAQGRYYHKGLYLSSGKYQEIKKSNKKSMGTWGCKIYSYPIEAKAENGLDCSGLMTWALYNAGFNPNDKRGANLLLNLGEVHKSKEIIDSGKVKVGDFVHNDELTSHIGMIIGIDNDENYYVCQSIWYKPNGVCISKYTKKEFVKHWLRIVLLDDYYKEDGNLTNMWY